MAFMVDRTRHPSGTFTACPVQCVQIEVSAFRRQLHVAKIDGDPPYQANIEPPRNSVARLSSSMPSKIATSATSSLSALPRDGSARLTTAAAAAIPAQAEHSGAGPRIARIDDESSGGYHAAMEAEAIRALLEGAFQSAAEVDVDDRTGTGDHFQVTVTSAEFDGISLLDQHRRVNAALAAPLADGSIHELRIKTKGTA
jgi:stress-induced morphogen